MGAVRGFAVLVVGALAGVTLSAVPPTAVGAGPSEPLDPAARSARSTQSAQPAQAVAAPEPRLTPWQVRRYWTPERMAAAVPVEEVLPSLGGATTYDATAARRGTSGPIPPRRVPRTVGKLFFSDDRGDYVCSAAAINTRRRDQVITAGHCVHTGPRVGLLQRPHYFRNWVFVPRYHRGRAPDGKWVARTALAFDRWIADESFGHDQAIIAFRKRNGRKLVRVVGGNDVVWGKPHRRWGVTIWGWPAESPYTGETARRCDGSTVRFEDTSDAAMQDCALNGGASGGPWFLPLGRTRNTGRIWAVTSRRLIDSPVLLATPIPREIRRLIRDTGR